jgi:hypothetical protein
MEISAKSYVDKMIDTYVQLYGEKPRKASSPLEQNYHPEMDDSPFLGQDETQQFQSLIGAMQWAVSIRRLDITTAVMSLAKERPSRESQANLWLSMKDERSKDLSAYQ